MDDIIQPFAIGISRTQRTTKLSNMTLSYNVPSTSTWCHLGGSYKLSLECVCNFLLTEGRFFFIYIFLLLPTFKNSSIPLINGIDMCGGTHGSLEEDILPTGGGRGTLRTGW